MDSELVPTDCPNCGAVLHLRSQPGWRYSKLSKLLFAIAGMGAFLSFFYVLQLVHYPDIPKHTIIEGVMVFSAMVLGGFVARKLPRVREVHCHRCRWRSTLQNTSGGS